MVKMEHTLAVTVERGHMRQPICKLLKVMFFPLSLAVLATTHPSVRVLAFVLAATVVMVPVPAVAVVGAQAQLPAAAAVAASPWYASILKFKSLQLAAAAVVEVHLLTARSTVLVATVVLAVHSLASTVHRVA